MTADFLILANSIFYGLPSTTKQQKLYWSKLIRVFISSINEGEVQWSESRGASKPMHHVDKVTESVKQLTEEEQIFLVAMLDVFYAYLVETGAENKRAVNNLVESLKELLPSHQQEKIKVRYQELQESLNEYETRPTINIPVLIWPLIADFILRCALLLFDTKDKIVLGLIITANALLIPILMISIAYWISNRDRKFNQNLLTQSGVSSYSVNFKISFWQYTVASLFVLGGSYVGYVLLAPLSLVAIFLLPLYYFIHLRFFNVGRLTEASVQEQLTRITTEHEVLDADRNDEEIVKLETRLNSITSRLEAYVLESALFGALCFSGFLQIMSDSQVTFDVLESFAHHVFTASQGIIFGEKELISSSLLQLDTKENLFGLLSFESLLCSILFLGVIASRLRFSDVSDRVQYSLNLSKAFNQKEEWLIESKEAVSSVRFKEVNEKVNLYLQHANTAMEEVQPVMALMQYLRNAGLLIFLVILVSSGFLITPVIAGIFIALSFLVWGYFNRKVIQQNMQYAMLQLRTSIVRFNIGLMISLLSIIVVGFVLRIRFQFPESITNKLIGIPLLLVIVYVFMWIVLYPHVDKNFGEIGQSSNSQWRSNKWLLIKVPFACLVVISIIGLIFKVNSFRGADEQILVGLFGMSLMGYFLGFYLSKPWWMGIMPALVLSTSLIGTLFKILHLEGADEMVMVSAVALVVTIPAVIILRKRFHKLFLVAFFTILTLVPLVLSRILDKIGAAYTHTDWPVDRLLLMKGHSRIWSHEEQPEVRLSMLKEVVEEGTWYLNYYGTRNGFTIMHDNLITSFEDAKKIALDEYKATNNKEWLETAERGAVLERKILEQFQFKMWGEEIEAEEVLTSEINLLKASNKQLQLIPVLDDLLKQNYSASFSKQVLKIKNTLKD